MTGLSHSWYQQQQAKLAYRRGVSCARKTLHKQAIAAFTQALEKGYSQPSNAYMLRGLSHAVLKDVTGAIADFDKVINPSGNLLEFDASAADAQPDLTLAKAYHYRGLLRQQLGSEAGALADWSAAIAYWPNYPEPHYQRALVYLGQGHHSKALSDLDAAIAGNPTLASAYMQRGNLRYQLGDIPGAVTDWEIAACNDFTLEAAKQKLATVQQDAYDAKLSAILKEPLAVKGLTVEVSHSRAQLDIHIHRPLGTGVNYYTLPDLIRKHLVPLHLADVQKFQLIGHVAEVNRPEWTQSYDIYKGQPCPPSNWQTAFSTLVVFPPFGIPAFIQAAQVKKHYQRGQYIEALRASKSVKGLCWAGSVTLGVFTLLPLSYIAYDSMQETSTFGTPSEQIGERVHRPYQQIRQSNSVLD
ncbi:MAG: tetratricopeptide repeat protein [Phormidesmis sp.]